jgi:hypothetical protein
LAERFAAILADREAVGTMAAMDVDHAWFLAVATAMGSGMVLDGLSGNTYDRRRASWPTAAEIRRGWSNCIGAQASPPARNRNHRPATRWWVLFVETCEMMFSGRIGMFERKSAMGR